MPLSTWIILVLFVTVYFLGVFVERFSYRRRILKRYEEKMLMAEKQLLTGVSKITGHDSYHPLD